MPVVQAYQYIARPEEAVELLKELLQDNAEQLGIQFVGAYDEKMIPSYPAIVISAGQTDKEVHGTHTFLITLRCTLWVYHADMTVTHQQRSLEDLVLATRIVAFLEEDKTYEQRMVFGYVESEVPGVIAPRAGKGSMIVGTKINWEAVTQQRWA